MADSKWPARQSQPAWAGRSVDPASMSEELLTRTLHVPGDRSDSLLIFAHRSLRLRFGFDLPKV
jgi:hypothetical protein